MESAHMSKMEGEAATVLVAEDEDAMRELVIDILESGGYKVIAVEDGEIAVKKYIEKKDEIDLVILDMIMPNLDGSETFRRLKAFDNDVRVLISSGFSKDDTARRLMTEGVTDFLGKPYQVGELLDKVQRALETK